MPNAFLVFGALVIFTVGYVVGVMAVAWQEVRRERVDR